MIVSFASSTTICAIGADLQTDILRSLVASASTWTCHSPAVAPAAISVIDAITVLSSYTIRRSSSSASAPPTQTSRPASEAPSAPSPIHGKRLDHGFLTQRRSERQQSRMTFTCIASKRFGALMEFSMTGIAVYTLTHTRIGAVPPNSSTAASHARTGSRTLRIPSTCSAVQTDFIASMRTDPKSSCTTQCTTKRCRAPIGLAIRDVQGALCAHSSTAPQSVARFPLKNSTTPRRWPTSTC